MAWLELEASAWRDLAREPVDLDAAGRPGPSTVIVRSDGADLPGAEPRPTSSTGPVVVVVAPTSAAIAPATVRGSDVVLVGTEPGPEAVACDDPLEAARELARAIDANPVAALSLGWLLRAEPWRDVGRGLLAESATYSMLLASEEARAWRQRTPRRRAASDGHRVEVSRDGDVLTVRLAHVARRNAMDARMRDALVEALQPARWDTSLRVVVTADGPTFSSGGDLAEFATTPDVGRAHLVRTASSVGRALAELDDRVEVRVHGECIGAGVEVPAFAARVVAAHDTVLRLPEVAMGLVPGAGGTVSVPRRIGRHRAAWMMLSGRPVEADTALAWGLVDELG